MIVSKTYKFLDTEYTTEKNVLKTQNAFLPMGIFFDKLNKMFIENVETDKIQPYKDSLKFYNDKMKIDKSDLENLKKQPELDLATIERVEKAIESNQIEIDKINSDYANDTEAQEQQAELNNATNYALATLISSFDIVKTFLDKYLIGDVSKLDYENPLIADFVKEVITDFFLSQMQNKAE
jgi:hypothetical protein